MAFGNLFNPADAFKKAQEAAQKAQQQAAAQYAQQIKLVSATMIYDTDILTNYLPGATTAAATPVKSYTINTQFYDYASNTIGNGSVLVQSSTPSTVYVNGKSVALNVTPIRFLLDYSGELCIIAPATGLTTATYTFSNVKDENGTPKVLSGTTVDPSKKALKVFGTIKTGDQLQNTPGRSGKTLFVGKTVPSSGDLAAAAQTFTDLAAASSTMPATPPQVQTALNNLSTNPLLNDGWPAGTSAPKTLSQQMQANAPATSKPPTAAALSVSKAAVTSSSFIHQQNVAKAIATLTAPQPTPSTDDDLFIPAPTAKKTTAGPHIVQKSAFGDALGTISSGVSNTGSTLSGGVSQGVSVVGGGLSQGASTVGGGLTQVGSTIAGGVTSTVSSLEGTYQTSADGVQRFYKKASDAAGWVLDASKQSWHYVVKIGNQVYDFLVKQVEDIGRVFDTVWNAIKLTWAELESYIGFLFDWDGIIQTQKTINLWLSGSLSQLSTDFKSGAINFDGIISTLKSLKTKPSAANTPDTTTSASQVTSDAATNNDSSQSSTPGKWFSYQSKHGGITNITGTQPTASTPQPPGFDKIQSDLTALTTALGDLTAKFATIFTPSGIVKATDVIASIADDVWSLTIDSICNILQKMLVYMGDMVAALQQGGDAKIQVPILSYVYKLITGQDLTLLSVISLLIAIPTSISYRITYGKPFPTSFTPVSQGGLTGMFNPIKKPVAASTVATASVSKIANKKFATSGVDQPIVFTPITVSIPTPTPTQPVSSQPSTTQPLPTQAASIEEPDFPGLIEQATESDTAMAAMILGMYTVIAVISTTEVVLQNQAVDMVGTYTDSKYFKRMMLGVLKMGVAAFTIQALRPQEGKIPAWGTRIAVASVRLAGAVPQGFPSYWLCTTGSDIDGWITAIETGTVFTCFVLDNVVWVETLKATDPKKPEDTYKRNMVDLQEGANVCGMLAQSSDMLYWLANWRPTSLRGGVSWQDTRTMIFLVGKSTFSWLRVGALSVKVYIAADKKVKPFFSGF